jgi:hypothetical protein
MAGCAIYVAHYLYVRYVKGPPPQFQGVPSIAK